MTWSKAELRSTNKTYTSFLMESVICWIRLVIQIPSDVPKSLLLVHQRFIVPRLLFIITMTRILHRTEPTCSALQVLGSDGLPFEAPFHNATFHIIEKVMDFIYEFDRVCGVFEKFGRTICYAFPVFIDFNTFFISSSVGGFWLISSSLS